MKIHLIFILCLNIFCLNNQIGKAQTELVSDPVHLIHKDHAIWKHYTKDQLIEMQQTDTLKLRTIIYYYSESYILTPIPCTNCVEYNLKKFDVSKVEKYRKKSERFEHDFEKYGVHLTLLSIDELEYKLPIHQ